MNDVIFNKQQGGLGRALPGSDYLSAMLFYSGTLPSGFTTTYNKKQIFAVSDAENLGIKADYNDETQATATYLITTKGNTADSVTLSVTEPTITGTPVAVSLGTYTVGSADTSIALQGAAWAAVINAGTLTHGYTAAFTTATLTVTARKGLGMALNSSSFSLSVSAAAAGSIVTSAIAAAGTGYAVNDTFTINTGTTLATGKVLTVTSGAVATYSILTAGAGYATASGVATTATTGVGTGLTLNITAVAPTFAGTPTAFAGGVYSKQAVWHYHIAEYFRIQPQGNLWLGFYPVPGSYTYAELQDLQSYAQGSIRQALVYNDVARTAANVLSDCTALQAVNATLESLHMPMSVVYAANIAAISDLSTLGNLATLTANKVSVCIAQDGGGTGALLFLTSGISITTGGALLGAVALAAVSEDIAWTAKFNISNGVECDTIALANGKLLSDPTVTTNLLNQLDLYRYIFLKSFVDFTGSYFNDSHCAIAQSSDYAYIENNRTIDKAIRVGRLALLPALNGPIKFNADGTLTNITIADFAGRLSTAASAMIRAGEISDDGITIDPSQKALTTSSIYITFQIIPNGVARNIIVNIGYTTSIAS